MLSRVEVAQTNEVGGKGHTHRGKTPSVFYKFTLWLLQCIQKERSTSKHTLHHPLTPSKRHRLTLYSADLQTLTRSRAPLFTLRLVVISLRPAPLWFLPLHPKWERGLSSGPRHHFCCFCTDGKEGSGIMPFHVSEYQHDAICPNAGAHRTISNQTEAHRKQQKKSSFSRHKIRTGLQSGRSW